MARRVLTDLTVTGDLNVEGYLNYSDINTQVSSSTIATYSDLKNGPAGYILVELSGTQVRVPYYAA